MAIANDGVIEITRGTGATTPCMGVTPGYKAKFYDLVMQASIILIDGQRVEQFSVNVYTRAITLYTTGGMTDLVFDGNEVVQLDSEGHADIQNVRSFKSNFEFYHATPLLPVTRVG